MLQIRHFTHLPPSYLVQMLILSNDANEVGIKENDFAIRSSFSRDDFGERIEYNISARII